MVPLAPSLSAYPGGRRRQEMGLQVQSDGKRCRSIDIGISNYGSQMGTRMEEWVRRETLARNGKFPWIGSNCCRMRGITTNSSQSHGLLHLNSLRSK